MKCLSVSGLAPVSSLSLSLGLHWTSPFADCHVSSQISPYNLCGVWWIGGNLQEEQSEN